MSTTSDCESVDERVKTSHAQSHFGAGAIGNTNRHPHPPPRTHVFENTVQDSVFSRESVRGSVLAHQGLVPSPQPTELRVGQPNDSEGRRATIGAQREAIMAASESQRSSPRDQCGAMMASPSDKNQFQCDRREKQLETSKVADKRNATAQRRWWRQLAPTMKR